MYLAVGRREIGCCFFNEIFCFFLGLDSLSFIFLMRKEKGGKRKRNRCLDFVLDSFSPHARGVFPLMGLLNSRR
jgi:hypothetical protein